MTLHRRGSEFSIRIGAQELMNSRMHGSEEVMAELACASLAEARAPRVLIGGLGMGFSLAAANRCLPDNASIDVAELMPAVIAWNRGPLGALAGEPLKDARVRVHEGDVRGLLERAHGRYDAVLLDVDNGPAGLTQESNQWLYERAGLARIADALRSRGILSIWSARTDARFTRRLGAAGFDATVHRVPARSQARGPKHCVWVATKTM